MPFTPVFADAVETFTTTTGTGAVTPGAAIDAHRTFASSLNTGDSFYYSIAGVTVPTEWEIGRGQLQGDGTITRDPLASSNAGALVDLSAGTKTIALIVASEWYSATQAELVNGQFNSVAITPPAGGGGVSSNYGLLITMANPGSSSDRAMEIVSPSASSSRAQIVLRKQSGGDFLRCFESAALGGTGALSTRVGAAAQYETRKWITISGAVSLGSFPDASDPRHDPTFIRPSAQPYMLGLYADVGCAFQVRPSTAAYSYSASFLDQTGNETLGIERNGDLSYVNNHTPTPTATDRLPKVLFQVGRRGRSTFAVKGGALGLQSFTEAQLNSTGPDAYEVGPGAAIWVSDGAPGAGLYVSDGFRWAYQPRDIDTGWGAPITTWDFSSAVANVDFTGLGAYSELRLLAWGLGHGAVTAQAPLVQVSTGGAFVASGYSNAGTGNLTTALQPYGPVDNTAALALDMQITDFNSATRRTYSSQTGAPVGGATGSLATLSRQNAVAAHDGLRVLWQAGGTFAAGSIQLFERKRAGGLVGPDSFGWTPAYVLGASQVITQSELRTFEKTASVTSWNASVYGTPTIQGDQLVEWIVLVTNRSDMVGLTSALPSSVPHYAALSYLGWQTAAATMRSVVNGALVNVNHASALQVGEKFSIRKVGPTVTLERNGVTVATLTTSAPDVPYYPVATFNEVGGKVGSMRHRTL